MTQSNQGKSKGQQRVRFPVGSPVFKAKAANKPPSIDLPVAQLADA